ncbi:MAG: hypothetical protein NVSMB38_08960 [Ktedonobacteraceae bacterium]
MNQSATTDERYTLEMIDGSYEVREEQEELLWRGFIDMFAKNHAMSDLFTFEEVVTAYHAYLHAFLKIAQASRLLDA